MQTLTKSLLAAVLVCTLPSTSLAQQYLDGAEVARLLMKYPVACVDPMRLTCALVVHTTSVTSAVVQQTHLVLAGEYKLSIKQRITIDGDQHCWTVPNPSEISVKIFYAATPKGATENDPFVPRPEEQMRVLRSDLVEAYGGSGNQICERFMEATPLAGARAALTITSFQNGMRSTQDGKTMYLYPRGRA